MTQIILRITAIIILVELSIVYIFSYVTFEPGSYVDPILHVILLTVFSSLIIYIWVIGPFIVAQNDYIEQIDHLAHNDPLTKLPNRRLLLDFTEKLISSFVRHKYYGALLFIGLDGFKSINDNHGHNAGDVVLIEVAKRLLSLVRAEDVVGRVGSDEFVVVLDQLSIDEIRAKDRASHVCERIQEKLSQPIDYKNIPLHIGSSIGLCLMTPERKGVELVLKDANTDMYRAKNARRDDGG